MMENDVEELFLKMAVRRKRKKKTKILDPDAELVERFLDGDEQAFNQLVLNYQNRVYGLCYRFLGNLDEAEEVAQEVFLTVYRSLRDFRGESRFSTWLYRVTVNHCKNRVKYLGRRGYFQSDSIEEPVDTGEGELQKQFVDDEPNPYELLARRELSELIEKKIMERCDSEKENQNPIIVALDGKDWEGIFETCYKISKRMQNHHNKTRRFEAQSFHLQQIKERTQRNRRFEIY